MIGHHDHSRHCHCLLALLSTYILLFFAAGLLSSGNMNRMSKSLEMRTCHWVKVNAGPLRDTGFLKFVTECSEKTSSLFCCAVWLDCVQCSTVTVDRTVVCVLCSTTRRSTLGDRAFPAAAARAWNSLPCHVRDMPSLIAFRRELKTVLFKLSYPVDR